MASDKHKRGVSKGLFHGIPETGNGCEYGNDYIKICKPSWGGFTFMRLVRRKLLPVFVFGKKYEAHHILCVAPVAKEIAGKDAIDGIIRKTKWCINNKKNMIGMPLWGHTVRWYCSDTLGDDENVGSPPFANIPQHDWDHNCKLGYTSEVQAKLATVAKRIEDAGHDVKEEDIKAALDKLSVDFKGLLDKRGIRRGGTHIAWESGGTDKEWYEPFSMASTGALTKKNYPVRKFDKRKQTWINRIAKAMGAA